MKTTLRVKTNTLQMWIADDVAWLLTHGITTDANIARARELRERNYHFKLVDEQERRECDRSNCECDICVECERTWHTHGSATRDANRFDPGPGMHLFGNKLGSTPEELLVLLQAFLEAGVRVSESR